MTISVVLAAPDAGAASRRCGQLAGLAGGAIAALATGLPAAAACVRRLTPDVLLYETQPGGLGGAATMLARVAIESPRTKVVVLLSDVSTVEMLVALVRQGASGWLQATSTTAIYAKAVAVVHAGQPWFGRAELLDAMRWLMPPSARSASVPVEAEDRGPLTQRERQVLAFIGAGLSNKEIGRRLGISDKTVKTHLHHIYVKLDRSGRYKAFLAREPQAPS